MNAQKHHYCPPTETDQAQNETQSYKYTIKRSNIQCQIKRFGTGIV